MNLKFFNIFLFLFIPVTVFSQEVISGLQVNIKVKQNAEKTISGRELTNPLLLPFFDDFSNSRIFPNPTLWSDNDAYINDDYAVHPPTIGVATLDAIDNLGRLYSNASPFPYMADFLTSQPIRLDSVFSPVRRIITRADSVYFSFYYQPQGFGNSPAKNDSLVLEFLAPGENETYYINTDTIISGIDTTITDTVVIEGWRRMWSASGQTLQTFYAQNNKWFRQVVIPVADSARFYTSEFRFRFRNYASLASGILPDWQSNGDQWNIDYVYLNIGRNIHDTLHRDVGFAAKAPSMLKNYTSMPYNQYRSNFVNEMSDSLNIRITNLDNINYNASYSYSVSSEYKPPFFFYSGGNYFIPPYVTSGYTNHQPFSRPPVSFVYPIGTQEKIFFTTTHILNTEANLIRRQNDTIRQVQVFANYLSYDDGTAEAGYGLTPAGAQLAYKFKLNRADSLLAIQMYFNQTLNGGNVKSFYINVWNDYFGEPGELIYSKFGYEPAYEDSLNKFYTYTLDSIISIEAGLFPNLIFYVGWEQTTSDNLNIGYDFNSDASKNTWYKTFGGWNQSLYKGAIMMRPVLGKLKVVGTPELTHHETLKIFPNPASSDLVAIEIPSGKKSDNLSVNISSADGKTIIIAPYNRDTDVSALPSGFYIVLVKDKNGKVVGRSKLIINR
ncbi:MAG: T9SS type A sorting domain-containing protein [Lentimicrobium sp.]|nr:T9SS type A sorting domain-containing protein [Lentimicrobium sp.]